MKRLSYIFLLSFLLNVVWENLHSRLYNNYMGGRITEFILLRASVVDAVIITLISLPFIYLNYLKRHDWIIIVIGILVAIPLEWFGLETGRWAYNDLMPIIPFLSIGLTPTIQLGFLGYLSYKFQEYI